MVYTLANMTEITDQLFRNTNLNTEEISRLLEVFEEKSFKKKDLLIKRGDVADHVFLIKKGCVRLFLLDYNGKEHSILFGTEGYWMGDLESFSEGAAATYNYQALEPTEVLLIRKSSWDKLLEQEPSFVKYTRELSRKALITQQRRIVEIFTLSAEQRYENLINSRPDIITRVPQKYIASYIGITPEFLSTIRSKRASR